MRESSVLRRVGMWLAETLPAFAIALIILPFVIDHGEFWPWKPSTTDLEIYRLAVQDMLAGKDFYATQSPVWNLYYIYPPVVLLMMLPTAFGPYVMWQILWTGLLVWAQQSILRRCAVPRGALTAVLGVMLVVLVEPIRTTLGYGQVNTFLMAIAVAAVLPAKLPDGRWRSPIWGVLIGVGAAVKLTPAYLAVVAFFSRRAAVAWWAFGSFCVLTLLGLAIFPNASLAFWTNNIPARTSGPVYVGNQSLFGMVFRWSPLTLAPWIGGLLALVTATAGIIAARAWWLRGAQAFALGIAGLVTCLVTPLSWTHHFVWVLPFGIGLALHRALIPRWQQILGWVWAGYISIGLPLLVLPFKPGDAERYTFGQDLIGNFSPLIGVVLVIAMAVWAVRFRPDDEIAAAEFDTRQVIQRG